MHLFSYEESAGGPCQAGIAPALGDSAASSLSVIAVLRLSQLNSGVRKAGTRLVCRAKVSLLLRLLL